MKDLEKELRKMKTVTAPAGITERFATRAAGQGVADVSYATVDSPIGRLLAAVTRQGLVRLGFPSESHDGILEGLSQRISPRVVEAPGQVDDVRRQLDEYFAGSRQQFTVPLDWALMQGFARSVLQRTNEIPYGQVRTYREVAALAGNAKASRAAGNALGSNPIPIIVPCHRVLRTGGALGGYGGGLEVKRLLLDLEAGGGR
jgi:methylated-DNA-[protein]-cysteine S-methyltransferase